MAIRICLAETWLGDVVIGSSAATQLTGLKVAMSLSVASGSHHGQLSPATAATEKFLYKSRLQVS